VADFSIDYSALHTVQKKMHDLADQADSGGATGAFKEVGEDTSSERRAVFGDSGLSSAFNLFYRRSSSRTKQAKDGLGQLADVFSSVANTFFDADAQLSSAAGLMGSSIGLDEWKNDTAAYEAWQEDKTAWDAYLDKIGAGEYFDQHPDADIGEVCRADGAPSWCETWQNDEDAPDPPGPAPEKPSADPPTEYTYEDEHGTVEVKVELNDQHDVMKETSTITTPDGQSYTSVTTYDSAPKIIDPEGNGTKDAFDARDYTMVTTYADGSKTTSVFAISDDGSGTMTSTDQDGKVTVSTRSGPDAEWVTPEDDEEE
jgi:hypothetical protein